MKKKELSEAEKIIKNKISDAIKKDGEGKRVGGHGNYYEKTGSRLWEPRLDTFKKSADATKKCPDIYYMEATDGQIDATYVGGDVLIAHNGFERAKVGDSVRSYQKQCKKKVI